VTDSSPAITLFGSALGNPGEELWNLAEQTGELLARSGYAVVNGGYGGTMEAAARGARRVGGMVTGVTVATFSRAPNSLSTRIIQSGTLFERLETLLQLGHGYIVFPGGSGTLVELALAWELANKSFSPPRPLIFLGAFWEPVVKLLLRDPALFRNEPTESSLPECPGWVFIADTPETALEILRTHLPPSDGVAR